MERIGAWLWREHQRHFIGMTALVIGTFIALTVAAPSIVVGAIFLHLGLGDAVAWFSLVMAVLAVVLPVTLITLRKRLESVRAWAGGARDPETARSAWAALLRFPRDATSRLVVVAGPGLVAGTLPWVLGRADADAQGSIALVLAYLMVLLTGAMLVSTMLQLVVRPAVADVEPHIDVVPAVERGGGRIRWRFVLVTFTSSWLTGVVLPAAVLGGSADSNDYLVALVGSAACAGYFGWLFDLGVVRPTLRPLGDVIDATARVRRGDVHTPVPVSSLDELGDLAAAFNEMQRGLAERQSLQAAFGSYVDPALAQRLVESGSSIFEGEEVELTVLFADVRDFTSHAELVTPAEAVEQLNQLFEVVVPVLHEHGGHANHYLGDGLLAVFGAPQRLERHADQAVAAAMAIHRRVRAELGRDLRLGIGINTGPVIAGTVGGGGRHEFTVIGDTVNTAARVEQLTKETGDAVLITEATRTAMSPPRPRTVKRGAFDLRGKSAAIVIHAVNPFPRSTR